jgi:hypothetical protein
MGISPERKSIVSFSRKSPGSHVEWSIGPRGEDPDRHPCRVVKAEYVLISGRPVEIVDLIALRTNLAGEQYLQRREVLGRFVFDRNTAIPELDGTPDAPKTITALIAEQEAGLASFLANRAATTSVDALMADLETA